MGPPRDGPASFRRRPLSLPGEVQWWCAQLIGVRRLPGGRPGRAICKMERTRPQGRAHSVALGEVLLGRRDADGCSLCCRVGRAPCGSTAPSVRHPYAFTSTERTQHKRPAPRRRDAPNGIQPGSASRHPPQLQASMADACSRAELLVEHIHDVTCYTISILATQRVQPQVLAKDLTCML
ncbi:hypothetical protein HPB51_009032 [Rhipicephalus microplus]|uniref:Uncharacterized protein n=1 Tax=Rhipicephalus microplus TaxID=6941 RepID=A0A9J6D9H5_RHIMP|nr:hypothetical protein HPB51_009032 [Rhipicephalus microplus]